MPTVEEVLLWRRNLGRIKQRQRTIKKEIAKLNKEYQELEYHENFANKIDLIYQGIPIQIMEASEREELRLVVPIDGKMRQAYIYLNARNRITYGAHLKEFPYNYSFSYINDEKWIGAGWKSKSKLRRVALDFLITGKLPEERAY